MKEALNLRVIISLTTPPVTEVFLLLKSVGVLVFDRELKKKKLLQMTKIGNIYLLWEGKVDEFAKFVMANLLM